MNSKFNWKGNFFDKKETKRGPNLAYYDIIWQEKSPKWVKNTLFSPAYRRTLETGVSVSDDVR